MEPPPDTPLYTFYDRHGRTCHITTTEITHELRAAAATIQHITNIPPDQIEAYGLRSGSATTLLISGVDQTAIRALGRWKSDAIFLYLCTQASSLTTGYAHKMLAHGQYSFSPSADAYADHDLLPLQAPRYLSDALHASTTADRSFPPASSPSPSSP